MEAVKQEERMLRKPILMPQEMVEKVNHIAKDKNVSFAKVVRDAVDAFSIQPTPEEDELLEFLADIMIETTMALTRRIEELESRINETHTILESR